MIIIDHPFWDDYVEAFRSAALREVDPDSIEKVKWLNLSLFPSSFLKTRWEGWQMGIRRPPESVPKEWLEQRALDVALFLTDFFKRVKNRKLYCDLSLVVEHFGEELVKDRIGKKSGLHFNLETVYWTFNVKFNKWIHQNIKVYDCSLVCELDEILSTADSVLRAAFFPMPGPLDIGPGKRKKLQKQILHQFAPTLEKPLTEQIWS